jgi:hypothetical protein
MYSKGNFMTGGKSTLSSIGNKSGSNSTFKTAESSIKPTGVNSNYRKPFQPNFGDNKDMIKLDPKPLLKNNNLGNGTNNSNLKTRENSKSSLGLYNPVSNTPGKTTQSKLGQMNPIFGGSNSTIKSKQMNSNSSSKPKFTYEEFVDDRPAKPTGGNMKMNR